MARLRLLFALLLMAVGTTFGAFALSGYYEPRMTHGQAVVARSGSSAPTEKPRLTLSHWARRLVADNDGPAAAPPAKPKAAAKAAPAKPKPAVSGIPPVKRPQQAAAPWPWEFFRN